MSDINCGLDMCVGKGLTAADFDTVFEIVSNRQRRVLLHQLEEDESARVEELVDEMIPHVEADPPQLTVGLRQKHLPKIDDTEILDYDPRSNTIRYYGHPFLEEVLNHTESEDLLDG